MSAQGQVAVIGAGAAGLAAAHHLQAAGIEVQVLEAADHIGGRCVTDTRLFGQPFDLGGSWLHSAPLNPLVAGAKTLGRALFKTPWAPTRVQTCGRDLSAKDVADYAAYVPRMWQGIAARGGRAPDVSTQAAMPQSRWQPLARLAIAQMLGGDADVTSAADLHAYADAEGDWLVQGGLGALVAGLFGQVPVRLGCAVRGIDTSGPRVALRTTQGDLQADQVILTVSTGVLAAGAIRFTPQLPSDKRDALAQLPMGLLNKVGLLFDPAWQEMGQGQMAEYHPRGEDYCTVLFGFYGTSLATGFVAGRFADALEREGPGAATAFCQEALEALFGADVRRHLRQTHETAWRQNPLTRGAYSFAKPGGQGARQVLARTVAERLFFAGEATTARGFATVHGAVQSGQDAAQRVIASRGARVL